MRKSRKVQELRKFEGHDNRVRGVAFAPDGKRLATGSWDTTARLWDVATGKQVGSLGHTSGLEGVAFSPDGKAVATAGGWENKAHVWDITDEGGRERWSGTIGQPFAVAFSSDGKKLAASAWDNTVRVWDAATGKESAAGRAAGHTGWVHTVSFLPDRKTLASAASDGKVILWDAPRGKELRHLEAPTPRVWCMAVAPDGKTLATGSHDQAVQLWDVGTGKALGTIKADGSVKGVAFSPDGRHLAAVSSEGSDEGSVKPVTGEGAGVWEVSTAKSLFRLAGHDGGVRSVAYSPDGKTLATGGNDTTVRLWDGATGKELRKLDGHTTPVNVVAFSPDGKALVSAAQGGGIYLRRLGTTDNFTQLGTPNGAVLAVAFSPDGRTLATATRGTGEVKAALRLWDVATGKERARFAGHQETAAAVAFSADGRVIASGGGDATVLLWDVTGRVENGKFATADLSPPSLESEWTELVGDDGMKAHRALWALVAAPKQSLPLLRDYLKPVPAGDAKRIAQLIKELDDDDFDVREKASAELDRIGEPAAPALRKALEGTPTAEVRIRALRLLDKFAGKVASPDVLRRERALEVLEQIGGAEARAILEEIAKGAPEAALTQQAKAALKRLGK